MCVGIDVSVGVGWVGGGWGMGLGCIFISVCISVREVAEMVVGGVNLCWWVQRSAELSDGGRSRMRVDRGRGGGTAIGVCMCEGGGRGEVAQRFTWEEDLFLAVLKGW